MIAVRVSKFGPPSVMRTEKLPALPAPAAGQALIKLYAAGVNPVDTYIRSGSYGSLPALPYTPGKDGAGEVVAVGPGVEGLRTGQRVWVCQSLTGTYAQYCLAEAERVCPLAEGLSFEQGACVGVPCLTAWLALHDHAGVRRGERVLIHGATGGVGLAAVRIAKAAGCVVLGTAGTGEGAQLVLRQGADQVFLHTSVGYEGKIKESCAGRGPDVIIEMLANVNLQRDLELLAPRGRVVIVGNRGEITINPRLLMTKDAGVRGLSLMNASPAAWSAAVRGVDGLIRAGGLRPVIREVLALAEAPRAHELVMAPGATGKIVLRIEH